MDATAQAQYMQLHHINEEAKNIQNYLENLDAQLAESATLLESLDEIKKLKRGDDILASLGNGVFIKAKIEDHSELIVSLGQNTVVSKSTEDLRQIISTQIKHLEDYRAELITTLQTIYFEAQKIETELRNNSKTVQ